MVGIEVRTLCDAHRQALRSSAISEEEIEARGYFTCSKKSELAALNFPERQRRVPALVIPIWGVDGSTVFHQIRPDNPRQDAKGKAIKYETPSGTSMRVDVPPNARNAIKNPSIPLWITEGVKKADAAVSHNLCCVALMGVTCTKGKNEHGGKTELADWDQIAFNNERKVFIAFDSDVTENDMVWRALQRIGAMVKRRGGCPTYVVIPSKDGRKVGLDDFFAAGGTVDELLREASLSLPQKPPPSAKVTGGSLPINLYKDPSTQEFRPFRIGDIGNAERFVTWFGNGVRHVPGRGWFVWDQGSWQSGDVGNSIVWQRAIELSARVDQTAIYARDEEEADATKKLAVALSQRRVMESCLKLAGSFPQIIASESEFDHDPYLLGVQNGTVDLRTGELRSPDPADMITMRAGCAYEEQPCPQFLEFLRQIMLGREDLMRFLTVSLGYSMTGDTSTHAFWFLTGTGSNGKGSLINLVQKIAGSYATTLMPESIMVKRTDQIPADIAKLEHKRLVTIPEVNSEKRLNEGLVKALSGYDPISARFLNANFVDFQSKAKIWMTGNQRPQVRNFDHALRRRIKVVPFELQVSDAEQDGTLPAKLWAEAPGILWLLVFAYREYLKDLKLPAAEAVEAATNAYQKSTDFVGRFLEDECEFTNSEARTLKKQVFQRYQEWCKENAVAAIGRNNFYEHLEKIGVKVATTQTGGNPVYQGLRLKGALDV